MWFQKEISISPKPRGFHIITNDILNNISVMSTVKNGILNLFIKHTSASLTINENADTTVRSDFESHFNYLVPEKQGYYSHTMEGPDDMPAHLKSSILGSSIDIPITNGNLNLGTWQGIYLCEHRNRGGSRKIVATINGDSV
tara:strand:+ start:625 stop:1050 length:426 start_codon:yes stop_codon:yes gene_type:complete